MDSDNDIKYLEQLSLGDHKAFEALFLKYFPKVKYFITHLIKSEEIAEELSQDIFTKIWINRKSSAQIQSFNSYIYRMAKNSAFNHLDHEYVANDYLCSYTSQDTASIEEEIYAKEIESLIQVTINGMPPQRKKVYEMSRLEGLKADEIASQLNLSKKTVENHLYLALKDVKRTISLSIFFFI